MEKVRGGGEKRKGIEISRYKGTCTKMSHEQTKQITKHSNMKVEHWCAKLPLHRGVKHICDCYSAQPSMC